MRTPRARIWARISGVKCSPAVGAATDPRSPREHGLVSLAIAGNVGAVDIGRQRDMPELLELAEEIRNRLKSQRALAELSVRDDLRPQRTVSEAQHFSRQSLAAGPRENEPFPFGNLLGQQHLDAAGGVVSGLSVQSCAVCEEARGDHAAVVQHEQIALAQTAPENPEHAVFVLTGRAVEGEHARTSTLCGRLLRNQLFGKFVVEIGNKHQKSLSTELVRRGGILLNGTPQCPNICRDVTIFHFVTRCFGTEPFTKLLKDDSSDVRWRMAPR